MILSTQVIDNKNEEDDSSSDGSIKDEELNELKNIINNNQKSKKINIYKLLL
jgi:hypothetical protein